MMNLPITLMPHTKIIGYSYRQVEITKCVAQIKVRYGDDDYYSTSAIVDVLHRRLCDESGTKYDNHQAFNVGDIWLRFDDDSCYIGSDAIVGFVGQY